MMKTSLMLLALFVITFFIVHRIVGPIEYVEYRGVPPEVSVRKSGSVSIVRTGKGYEPREITVPTGTTVSFSTSHDFLQKHMPKATGMSTASVRDSFHSSREIQRGQAWEVQLSEVGDIYYVDARDVSAAGIIHVTRK